MDAISVPGCRGPLPRARAHHGGEGALVSGGCRDATERSWQGLSWGGPPKLGCRAAAARLGSGTRRQRDPVAGISLAPKQANADTFAAHEKIAKATISVRAPLPFARCAGSIVVLSIGEAFLFVAIWVEEWVGFAALRLARGRAPVPSRAERRRASDSTPAGDRSSCVPVARSA